MNPDTKKNVEVGTKRKPDDEFALINLSYVASDGREVVVHCPETKGIAATLEPARRTLSGRAFSPKAVETREPQEAPQGSDAPAEAMQPVAEDVPEERG